jgi:cell division protein YceG involved in septum cleavage
MENKKVGVILLIIGVVLGGIFLALIDNLNTKADALGCFQDPSCTTIETSLNFIHFGFGIFGFLFALSFYLLFFSQGEKAIVKRLEDDTTRKLAEEKFAILLKGLDAFERDVLTAVRNEDGITQNTLKLKVNMSKAKLSHVLTDLESKKLISRVPEGKTLKIYFKNIL